MKRYSLGFGLIEVMVALVLGVMLVLGITQIFLSARVSYLSQLSSAQMQEDARYVLSKLAQQIRMAGMFGCLPLTRVVDVPAAFQTPISWDGAADSGALRMISADVGLQAGKPDWTVVSDCKARTKVYSGAYWALSPGEIAFPVRHVVYRFDNGQLRTGLNNAVLLDNVAAFDVSFGMASSSQAQAVVRYERIPVDSANIRSVKIALLLRDPKGRVKDQAYHLVVAVRNRLG